MASSCKQDKKFYINTIGISIHVETGENISLASELVLRVKKPDGTIVNWAGSLEGLTKIKYTVVSGDLDQAGIYYLQAYVKLASWTGLGETTNFTIYNSFK